MAAVTPTKTYKHSVGDLTMHIVQFTNITTGGTWDSGIPGIVEYWAKSYAGTSTGEAALVMSVTESSDTFTFYPVSNATTGTLFVLSYS